MALALPVELALVVAFLLELALVVAFLELALVLALPACVELAAAMALLRRRSSRTRRSAGTALGGILIAHILSNQQSIQS